jgi:signal peptidase II
VSTRVGTRRPLLRPLAIYGTALLVIGLDQLIKYLVVRELAGRPPFKIIGDFVELRYTTNSGGAFSLLTGAPVFFALMAIVVIGGILYASRRARGLPIAVALGLLLGGAVGNLLDRIFRGDLPLRGEVVDFVKIGIWPLFNLADSCVVVGGILLALLLGRPERSGDRPAEETGPAAGDDAPGAGGDATVPGAPGAGDDATAQNAPGPASRPDPAATGEPDRGTGAEARSRPI